MTEASFNSTDGDEVHAVTKQKKQETMHRINRLRNSSRKEDKFDLSQKFEFLLNTATRGVAERRINTERETVPQYFHLWVEVKINTLRAPHRDDMRERGNESASYTDYDSQTPLTKRAPTTVLSLGHGGCFKTLHRCKPSPNVLGEYGDTGRVTPLSGFVMQR
ncbi:hypothetical protein P175DRAFT_0555658 [Aspergillus ochraceoroseus IBT 24754]|uniref:Uncharacterized protein n=1 Tax=Aspergillus ochraceoroseus IBT 24754 TaxID=1392256 RepID=A0A2T5M381_9EURO|nr:uncharacterized protein P175DRAFT_0555658 [Aspergillus ochraceoroseus IBT 24754]PTU22998.1 hypothetical protein P175DRAFT_0555658 [Aspergillus ochraceoroseus IBT 24754]